MHRKLSLNIFTLLITSLLILSGCEQIFYLERAGNIAYQNFIGDPVNVKAKSYAAADYLDQNMRSYVGRKDLVTAHPLYIPPNDYGEELSDLAVVIPYQIGSRLSELGYTVDLQVLTDTPTAGLKQTSLLEPRFILSGSFHPKTKVLHLYREVDVSVNVLDKATGKVIASFDYNLPQKRKSNDEVVGARKPAVINDENADEEQRAQGEQDEDSDDDSWLPFKLF